MHFSKDYSLVDLTECAKNEIERLVRVRRENIDLLVGEILNVIYAVGIAHDGSEARQIWHELGRAEPSPAEAANLLERLSKLDNPFAAPEFNGDFRLRLSRSFQAYLEPKFVGTPEAFIQSLNWADLSETQQAHFRDLAAVWAAQIRRGIPRGRPPKEQIDTLIRELASIFVDVTGHKGHLLETAYAVKSRFIQFAHLVLSELAGQGKPLAISEVTEDAISRRWERIVLAGRKGGVNPAKSQPRKSKKKL
jgi:hypothetical protein